MSRPLIKVVSCGLFFLAVLVNAYTEAAGLKNSVHNLTATGRGKVKEPGVDQICVFCHTPHSANPAGSLWNLDTSPQVYILYESSTSQVELLGRSSQPTGASRLCLSCHDGTLAMGNLRRPPRSGRPLLGPLTGRSSLGVDLSDDHPVSFRYDRELALQHGRLVNPKALPNDLVLDAAGRIQCTTCHDPHDDPYRKFLRMDDRNGLLCLSCHLMPNWSASVHATSSATPRGQGPPPWAQGSPFKNVAENGCGSCHRAHSAPGAQRLLSSDSPSGVCLACHNGSITRGNLENEFQKGSVHPISSDDTLHDPNEDPDTMPRHVTCVDCHNPHRTVKTPRAAPGNSRKLWGVNAVNLSGDPISEATQEYEVCFKCHGVFDEDTLGVIRKDNVRNVRLEVSSANRSYHPVTGQGANPNVRGFEPGYSASSLINCTDCHDNDESPGNGSGPRGPHGSRYAPLLEREYQTDDPTPESAQSFALCYKCHNRTVLINDRGDGFSHAVHTVDQQAPCAACHDAHGSRDNAHLINFMLADRNGQAVVTAAGSGRFEYNDMGMGGPECYLQCHGVDHDPIPGLDEPPP